MEDGDQRDDAGLVRDVEGEGEAGVGEEGFSGARVAREVVGCRVPGEGGEVVGDEVVLEEGGGEGGFGVEDVVVAEGGGAGGGGEEVEEAGGAGLRGGGVSLAGGWGGRGTDVGFKVFGFGGFGEPGAGVEDPLEDLGGGHFLVAWVRCMSWCLV